MATASFINTFADMSINSENPEGATFTKDQLQEWAKNAAEAGSKSPVPSDSDSNSDTGAKSTRKKRKNKQKRGENRLRVCLCLNETVLGSRPSLRTTGSGWRKQGVGSPGSGDTADVHWEAIRSRICCRDGDWRTEHPEEAEATKEKKEKKTKKAKESKPLKKTFTPGEAPEAPPGMTGPFTGYLAKTAKNADGKSSFKDFTEAVAAAMELGDDCGGVTRTTRGWSLRKAVTLGTDGKADRKEISYIKSQFVSEELAKQVGITEEPASETESVPEPVQTEEKPKKKRGRPSKKKEPEPEPVKEPEPEPEPEPVKEPEPVEEAGGKSDYEAETEDEEDGPEYSEDEVEDTVSWEFKGKDYEVKETINEKGETIFKVYAIIEGDEDKEDPEYELVGYRKVRKIEIMKNGKKMFKKEVYIDEPWKN